VFTSRCTNARSVLLLRSSARFLVVDIEKGSRQPILRC
jgi:hypothetical protein